MIIYQESKAGYMADINSNALQKRLREASLAKTGSVPADSYVWADEYTRFAIALDKAEVSEELADVLHWVLLLSHDLKINVLDALDKKLKKNAQNYPVSKSNGRHTKYAELHK